MADIFLSYSSADRDRVRPLHAALVHRGFEVFWDQTVPIGRDWDTWIRERLADARAVVVVWTHQSVQSKNVRHEAVVAQEHGKLVSVLIDTIPPAQFPLGLYAVEAADLSSWSGDAGSEELERLLRYLEQKLTPVWLKGVLNAKDHLLADERAGRAVIEGQMRTLREQIGRDAAARAHAQDELNRASTELGQLRADVEIHKQKALERATSQEVLDGARVRVAELEGRITEIEASRSGDSSALKRWRWAAIGVPILVLTPALMLYVTAVTERDELVGQLGEVRQQLRTTQADLATARADLTNVTQRAADAERRLAAAATPVAPAEPTAPEPDPVVCPDVDSKRYWTDANTFVISKAFSRSCLENSAQQLYESDDSVARLFKRDTGAAGTVQFAAYVLSINGVAVNPVTCSLECLRKGLRPTTQPAAGDLVVFINDTVGIFSASGGVYELLSDRQTHTVVRRPLARTQVKSFLSVGARATEAPSAGRKAGS
jgi:hypothetical protein